jgi:hypothetical protein
MSDARKLKGRQVVGAARCECGNSAEHGGIYPCDSEGNRLPSSDLVCCERCDKIVVRETGQLAGYRSLALAAGAGW